VPRVNPERGEALLMRLFLSADWTALTSDDFSKMFSATETKKPYKKARSELSWFILEFINNSEVSISTTTVLHAAEKEFGHPIPREKITSYLCDLKRGGHIKKLRRNNYCSLEYHRVQRFCP
jgi:hypothetical protein